MGYGRYLGKTFWPGDLSPLYFFHSQRATFWEVATVGVALATVSMFAVLTARRRPWFFVGWLWFLGVLVPMIGIVQTGVQSFADRYAYLPHIGFFVALAWGAGDLVASRPRFVPALTTVCVATLVSLSVLSFAQARVWRDTIRLFSRALEVAPDNLMAEMYLARALQQEGRLLEADEHFLHLLEKNPGQSGAHLQVGMNAFKRGDAATASKHLAAELQNNPNELAAHFYLARTLEQAGRNEEARGHYSAIVVQDPLSYSGRKGLGLLLGRAGDWRGALEHLRIAQTLAPGDRQLALAIADAEQRLGLRK
jgi:tetratricopeptide (TPR) repeat protein